MKRNSSLLRGACLGALLLVSAHQALAQSNAKPPTQLTYQGFLTDGNGLPFGNSAPVNKTVIFRIYDALTGGNLKWSSQQVVTVDKGYFSVLLGQGSAVGGDPASAFNADLTGVFTGNSTVSDRYLELNADGTTIAPRLRFLPAPYAMLAKSATELLDPVTGASSLSVSGGNITSGGNLNVNTINSVSLIAGAGHAATGSLTSHSQGAYLEWNKENGYGMTYLLNQKGGGNGGIVFGEISTANTITERMRIDSAGNVGIGTTSPAFKLDVNGDARVANLTANAITVSGNGTFFGNTGIGIVSQGFYGDGGNIALRPPSGGNTFFQNFAGARTDMFIANNGNVSIGNTSPEGRLHLTEASGTGPSIYSGTIVLDHENSGGVSSITFRSKVNRSSDFGYIYYQDDVYGNGGESSALIIGNQNDWDDNILLLPSGRVGIGTTTPVVKLDVRNSVLRSQSDFKNGGTDSGDYADKDHGQNNGTPSGGLYVTIRSEAYVEAQGVVYYSDKRIKDIANRVNTGTALDRINQLQVTDYRMVDKVQNGNGLRTGLIAQEVQAVMPEAVLPRRDFVPTVYTNATALDFDSTNLTLTVTLPKPHGFSAGDLVRFYDDKGVRELKVLSVANPTNFVVTATNKADGIFVFGKEVNDFLSVDYDRIFTTGLGAIQELSKLSRQQAEALRKNEARISELEQKTSRLTAMESELAEMKRMLARLTEARPDARPTAQTVTSDIKTVVAR